MKLDSFSLVPHHDKSLLLINSGMAPLKPYFIGEEVPPKKRVTTCQKCIRTPDIDNVGKTSRHGTFFEMLGNFSFGDYFKTEAINFAWEFLTKVVGIDEDKLYVSVYEDDDEAVEIWKKEIGLSDDRITRLGKEDNFWEIGTGPCGPCSEIYVDRGEEYSCGSPDCKVGCDCDRYVEVWNLVFTQFDRDKDGNYSKLAHPNIDTGMGLERLAAYCQGVDTIFEVDTIRYILDYVCSLAGVKYGEDKETDVSIRVITDHIRSVVFMISDGILPSNEGRGYVLKRLIRRTIRHGMLIGIKDAFIEKVAEKVMEISGKAYPELIAKKTSILKVLSVEEKKFNETINQGLELINSFTKDLKVLSGEEAFKLYDTFGFPIELTNEIMAEKGITVDMDGFEQAMKEQKEKARNARSKDIISYRSDLTNIVSKFDKTEFDGYVDFAGKGKILSIIKDNEEVDLIKDNEEAFVIFDKTPFYAESGGQECDTGKIMGANVDADVTDVTKSGDKFIHQVKIKKGILEKGNVYDLSIYRQNRLNTQRNHSATHLLHSALKRVLGEHVNQAGSSVNNKRLRFDFSHYEKMTDEQIKEVEKLVNAYILSSTEVTCFETEKEKASELGAMALFGEKYGKIVRVVKMGNISTELCGGCHVNNTNEICMFKIISESSVSSGVRRIEALTGLEAIEYSLNNIKKVEEINQALKTKAKDDEEVDKIEDLIRENKELRKEVKALKSEQKGDIVSVLLEKAEKMGDIDVIISEVEDTDAGAMRELCDKIKDKAEKCVIFLLSVTGDKGMMIASASKDVVKDGFHCGNFIREVAKSVSSGGGGRPDMAQAGLKDITRAAEAVENAKNIVKDMI